MHGLLAKGMPVELLKNEVENGGGGSGFLGLLLNALDNRGEISKLQ